MVSTVCFQHTALEVQPTFSMVPVIGATAPPWAPEPLTPARYLGTGTDTCALPSCTKSGGEGEETQQGASQEALIRKLSATLAEAEETDLGEEVHRVVQDHQLGARLHAVDGAVQEGGSAFRLHLPSHVVRLFTNLETTTKIVNDQIKHNVKRLFNVGGFARRGFRLDGSALACIV